MKTLGFVCGFGRLTWRGVARLPKALGSSGWMDDGWLVGGRNGLDVGCEAWLID